MSGALGELQLNALLDTTNDSYWSATLTSILSFITLVETVRLL